MYKSIIYLRKDIPEKYCKELEDIANDMYDNYAGKLVNQSDDPYVLLFQGDDEVAWHTTLVGERYLCVDDFTAFVDHWEFIDEENPAESCNVITGEFL